jgi:hypothetical protein
MVEILDAKYEKADLPAIIGDNSSHCKASDREKLLSVLLRFELLFNGTLGDWNLPLVSFELRKEGMKPYHGFIIPKKDNIVYTISDFREVNTHVVRKPYPIPKSQHDATGAKRLHLCHSP